MLKIKFIATISAISSKPTANLTTLPTLEQPLIERVITKTLIQLK